MKQHIQGIRARYFAYRQQVSPEALQVMHASLLEESTADLGFWVLTVGSCLIATLGLLANSAAVIIGAMLIAPLMLPIRGASFGILEVNERLIRASGRAILMGSSLAIAVSMGVGLATNLAQYGSEVLARSRPTLLDLGIALAAGAMAGFAKVEPKWSESLAGTAIAVALMPPLCVVGLWLAQFDLLNALNALLLYATNLLGITLACMVAFGISGYSPGHRGRGAIRTTLALTLLLGIPLGYSTLRLWQQNSLESSLRRALLDRTVTFQRVRLIDMETDWWQNPPEVTLTVYSSEAVTPVQVDLLEKFIAGEMGRPFRLLFEVSQVDAVTSDPVQEETMDGRHRNGSSEEPQSR